MARRVRRVWWALLLASPASWQRRLSASAASPLQDTANLTYWCAGDCAAGANAAAPHEAGIVLMGGGTDVDAALKKMIEWGANGNFLVIRTSGDDGYNAYVRDDLGGDAPTVSAATLLTKRRAAGSDLVALAAIDRADAIFFAGGDQDEYLRHWQGTPMQARLQAALDERHVPMGGTSAGCMVQGGRIYTAANGTVLSDEALEDPYNE
jgi:cyanophycinase